MKLLSFAVAGLALAAATAPAPVAAQSYGHGYGGYDPQPAYGHPYGYKAGCRTSCGHPAPRRRHHRPSYNGQADRPGDYRCDAYWDAGRADCNAAWRDQRPWTNNSARRVHHYERGYAYGGGYAGAYASAGASVYAGAYGQPDVVYSGGGSYGGGHGGHGHDHGAYPGRDPRRIAVCCAEYRSYDIHSGYYVAYSGERVFCG